jgi:hypothetical protein
MVTRRETRRDNVAERGSQSYNRIKENATVVTLNGCPVVVVCSPLSFKDLASDHLDGGFGESQVRKYDIPAS